MTIVHRPETQTLYAQLLEAAVAREVSRLGGFGNGLAVERVVKGNTYLYWQERDLGGKLKQVYLGPTKAREAIALRDALVAFKQARSADDLESLAAAYVASGGSRNIGAHYKIVEALARAGLFRAGAVLVGSHAFVSIGAALGVTWSADDAATADVDLCRDAYVTVACDELVPVDVPGALSQVDPTFFLVPDFDLKTSSSSLMSNRTGAKVDLLTTAKTPRDTKPRIVAPFSLAAQPLRYMDYLVRHGVGRSLFIGPSAILVNVPDAARFALHKLAVATRRKESAIKARKDRRQAEALILVLADLQPGALAAASRAARAHHDRGFARDVRASLSRLGEVARRAVSV